MNESMNKLTNDEITDEVKIVLEEVGLTGAASIAWSLMEKEAEKITSDITDDTAKRLAELNYINMMLEQLKDNYQEELDIANGGDEPTYFAG